MRMKIFKREEEVLQIIIWILACLPAGRPARE
jgi:hypothetical protein